MGPSRGTRLNWWLKINLCLAAKHKWNLQQLDIKNAFLHEDLEKEIYMETWIYKADRGQHSLQTEERIVWAETVT